MSIGNASEIATRGGPLYPDQWITPPYPHVLVDAELFVGFNPTMSSLAPLLCGLPVRGPEGDQRTKYLFSLPGS